ncbi:hypothetical protein D043_3582B, partial [Vibrio parahaemolyticus EKP-021]
LRKSVTSISFVITLLNVCSICYGCRVYLYSSRKRTFYALIYCPLLLPDSFSPDFGIRRKIF